MENAAAAAGATRVRPRRPGTREKLLRAGLIQLSENQPSGVTIDQLVQGANVAKGSFYNHFPDREKFESDVLREARRRMARYIGAIVGNERDDAVHIARAVCAFARFSIEYPHETRIILRWIYSERLVPEDPTKFIVRRIRSGLISGRFVTPSVEAGALVVFGIGRAVALTILAARRTTPDLPLVRDSVFLILRALEVDVAAAITISSREAEQVLQHPVIRRTADIGSA